MSKTAELEILEPPDIPCAEDDIIECVNCKKAGVAVTTFEFLPFNSKLDETTVTASPGSEDSKKKSGYFFCSCSKKKSVREFRPAVAFRQEDGTLMIPNPKVARRVEKKKEEAALA